MGWLYERLRAWPKVSKLEEAVGRGVAFARGKPQSFHDIPLSSISPSSWASTSQLLSDVGSFVLPCDKLEALVAVAHAIPTLHQAEHPPGPGGSSSGREGGGGQLGADELLPVFIYVLVNSSLEEPALLALVLETLCDPTKVIGEAGFCLATLSAALKHLTTIGSAE
ncbi:unnamed protein product [Discosporangium mesarthrocarpum]